MNKTQVCGVCHKRARLIDPQTDIRVCVICDGSWPAEFTARLRPIEAMK